MVAALPDPSHIEMIGGWWWGEHFLRLEAVSVVMAASREKTMESWKELRKRLSCALIWLNCESRSWGLNTSIKGSASHFYATILLFEKNESPCPPPPVLNVIKNCFLFVLFGVGAIFKKE